MKERAENLRERAQKLAENANQKLEIFQGELLNKLFLSIFF